MSKSGAYTFDNWTVEPDRCIVARGSDVLRLKPKAMDVLVALIRADGQVVSRRQLFEQIWPNSDVSDDVLTHCIAELRRALGDSAREPRYIETIPRRGVRLIPAVVAETSDRPVGQAATSTYAAVGLLFVCCIAAFLFWFSGRNGTTHAVPAERSVAVLPFVDMSENGDQEHFADGITEELINQLVKLDGLLVTGRTSSFYFKGRNEAIAKIGEQLQVATLLQGSIRVSGDRMRISTQLVEVDSGFHLWSETYDRELSEIFAIQEDIAESVARSLSIELGVGARQQYAGNTDNIRAHELVLKGNSTYQTGKIEDFQTAIGNYRRAVELDPDFAIGWERLASTYLYSRFVMGAEYWATANQLAQDAIERALELAPNSTIVLQTAAYLQIVNGDFFSARSYFERLRDADVQTPLSRSATYIDMLMKTGHIQTALELQKQNKLIDPKRGEHQLYLAHALNASGRVEEALALLETEVTEKSMDLGVATEGLVGALTLNDVDLITLWLQRIQRISAGEELTAFRRLQQLLGKREESIDYLRSLYAVSANTDYLVAVFAGYYGDQDLVLDTFRRSADFWIYWYPLFAPMRRSDAFVAIAREQDLVRYWQAYGFNDYCRIEASNEVLCR